jgi:hypothetical protein
MVTPPQWAEGETYKKCENGQEVGQGYELGMELRCGPADGTGKVVVWVWQVLGQRGKR